MLLCLISDSLPQSEQLPCAESPLGRLQPLGPSPTFSSPSAKPSVITSDFLSDSSSRLSLCGCFKFIDEFFNNVVVVLSLYCHVFFHLKNVVFEVLLHGWSRSRKPL